MTDDLYQKIYDLVQAKLGDEFPDLQSSVDKEMGLLQEQDILKQMFKFYLDIQKDPQKKGNTNCCNSIVAYALGITSKQPDNLFSLEKRRTYGRSGWPDIDMDFDYERRNEIIQYLFDTYGEQFVANIGTTQRLKTKATVRRVIKTLDPSRAIRYDKSGKQIKSNENVNFILENRILKTLPELMKRPDGTFVNDIEEAYEEYEDFKKEMDAYPEVYRVAQRLEGRISGFGAHAGGWILSPEPLDKICPLHATTGTGKDKVTATQFSMDDVESLGLIKFDILGIATKTAIGLTKELVKERHGVDIDLSSLPLDDKPTLDLLDSGLTDGCFQLEKPGMKQTLQQIGIDSFDDLVVAIAMFRPGPKDYIPELAKRKRGQSPVSYAHPKIKEIVSSTWGIICYQEQVMQVFMTLANLTATDGYKFMKGCAKKQPEIIEEYKEKFYKGCLDNNIAKNVIEKVFKDLERFSGYAFNKSLQYNEKIITTKQEFSIQELHNMKLTGDEIPHVFSQHGEKIDIVDVHDHGMLPVYESTFEDGSTVSSTLNHKFMTFNGIVSLDEVLRKNLRVIQNGDIGNDNKKTMEVQRLPFGVRNSPQDVFPYEELQGIPEDQIQQQVFAEKPTKIRESQQATIPIGISSNTNFLRHLVGLSQTVQVLTFSKDVESRSILHRKRCYKNNWKGLRIIKVKFAGFQQCYDLEVDSPDHLYCLANGIVNSNSHSVSYAYESYKTAYLKAHYDIEFIAARLSVEIKRRNFDDITKYEADAVNNKHIKILPPDLNISKMTYKITGEREIRRPILIKGIGIKAAEDIVLHQPYKGHDILYSFASRVGSAVNTKVLETMCDAGLWGEEAKRTGKARERLLRDFEQIKKDKRVNKGRPSGDIFS